MTEHEKATQKIQQLAAKGSGEKGFPLEEEVTEEEKARRRREYEARLASRFPRKGDEQRA